MPIKESLYTSIKLKVEQGSLWNYKVTVCDININMILFTVKQSELILLLNKNYEFKVKRRTVP